MRVGIDIRLWSQAGVGRYIGNLILELLEVDKKNHYVLFALNQDKKDIENQISKLKIKNEKLKIVYSNIKWHSLSEQIRLPGILKKENLDLMHFTYQQSIPILYNRNFVVTIHDLIKHHFITGRSSTNPLWLLGFKMLAYKILINVGARKSKKIIAVSNTTKRNIINLLGVKEEKINVIYEAANDFGNDFEETDLENYFLYVGNIYSHKNLGILINAFLKLYEKNNKLKIVFVGNDDIFYKKLKKDFDKYFKNKSFIFFENISDKKLAGLYRKATALVRPSLMEGFSLPPLEAAANKCLILASDIPVHREIFGDTIIYFDPYNPSDILSKMEKVLNIASEEKKKILDKQFEIQKKFSWENTAKETLNVYESIKLVG